MPLERSSDRIVVTLLGVSFLMRDHDREVACRADRDLLRFRFGSADRNGDRAVFERHRDEIERAASEKYDAGKLAPHDDEMVVVTEYDVASPLSRKLGRHLAGEPVR